MISYQSSIVTMYLSCTISNLLSIISQNLKKSPNVTTHLRDYLSIRRLIVHIANQCTKSEVASLSHSTDILRTKNLKWGTWCDHTPFLDSLSSIGWNLVHSTCTPNLKSLCSPTTKIWKATHNVEIWVVWELEDNQGHWQCRHSIESIRLPIRL